MSDSPVIAFLNKMTDLILLNMIYILCCLPIVTIGAATTAMYYVCIISIRQGDGYVVRRFFESFKKNFRQATTAWLGMLVIGIILAADMLFWYRMNTGFAKIMFVLSAIVGFSVWIIGMYIFPVIAKLEGNMLRTIKNSAAFAVGYLPYTACLLLISVIFIYANLVSVGMNAITVFVGFAVVAYIKSFFIYKVMMNHIEEKFDDFIN